jgi:hypothetical protein
MSKVSCPLHLVDTGAPLGGSAAKGADILESPLYTAQCWLKSSTASGVPTLPNFSGPQHDSRRRAPVRALSVRTSHRSSLDDARRTSGEGAGKTHYCDRIAQTRVTATTTAISERLRDKRRPRQTPSAGSAGPSLALKLTAYGATQSS